MESLVFLSACLKRNAVQGIVENLEPFANIDKQDGIIYYRAIVTLKFLFALRTMTITFPERLSRLMLVIGNVYVATTCPEIAFLSAISLCFQLFSRITGNRFVCHITIAFMGAIAMNIKQYEFILDVYVLISILWFAFETYNREIQKLCSVVSVVLTVGWYACKEYAKNPTLLNKCSICAFLVLAYAPLRPNRGNKHRHRLLYFYALFFTWLLYQFHQFNDTKLNVIGEINKTHSDVISHTLGTDSVQQCSEKFLYDKNSKNALTAKIIDNVTCSESHSDSFKDSISTKDHLFLESGKSKKYFKDVNSGEGSTMQSDASKPFSENSILQKSLVSNMNHGNEKMTEISDKDKPKMQPTVFTTIDEKKKQKLISSLSDIEDTSSQVKKNKNKDVSHEQNYDHVTLSETLKVEPHQKQIVATVPAQNKITESYQIKKKEFVTQSEVSKQNEESELSHNKGKDFLTKTGDISSDNEESELPIIDKTIINVPVRVAEIKKVHISQNEIKALLPETKGIATENEESELPITDKTFINVPVRAPGIKNIHTSENKRKDVLPKTAEISSENEEPELPITDKTIINVPVRAAEMKKVHSASSNTQAKVEEILNRYSIDVKPTSRKLHAEVNKELSSNFGEKNIANVDTMKLETETIINEETEQNIRIENRKNLDVVPEDLSFNDDEWNNHESKMITNILNLIDFKVDFDDSTGKKLNVKVKDTNEGQSDLSEELDE